MMAFGLKLFFNLFVHVFFCPKTSARGQQFKRWATRVIRYALSLCEIAGAVKRDSRRHFLGGGDEPLWCSTASKPHTDATGQYPLWSSDRRTWSVFGWDGTSWAFLGCKVSAVPSFRNLVPSSISTGNFCSSWRLSCNSFPPHSRNCDLNAK